MDKRLDERFSIGLIVNNYSGVLNRVAGLYAKRGYNIDSLAVGVTENPAFSRITIVSCGDDYMKEQVVRQLQKLHDVKSVTLLENERSVSVEHMLIKLKANGEVKAKISELINEYGGKTMDFGGEFITAALTASSEQLDVFLEKAGDFGIYEVCRSGAIVLSMGTQNMLSIDEFTDESVSLKLAR